MSRILCQSSGGRIAHIRQCFVGCKLGKMTVLHVRCQSTNVRGAISFDGFLEQHLIEITERHKALAEQLAASISNSELARLGKESASLAHIVELTEERSTVKKNMKELEMLEKDEKARYVKDYTSHYSIAHIILSSCESLCSSSLCRGSDGEEMALLARSEIDECNEKLADLEERIVKELTPRDDADEKGVVLEVRAGTGRYNSDKLIYLTHQPLLLLHGTVMHTYNLLCLTVN